MIASPLSDECNEVETFGFEDNSYVTDENTEIVACETYMTDVDAYSGTTSGLVTERTQSWGGVRHLLSEFPAGRGFWTGRVVFGSTENRDDQIRFFICTKSIP